MEGGTNQPPLVGSAKQTWPGAEEEANIRSTRMEREKRTTHAHTTQTHEMYKPSKTILHFLKALQLFADNVQMCTPPPKAPDATAFLLPVTYLL